MGPQNLILPISILFVIVFPFNSYLAFKPCLGGTLNLGHFDNNSSNLVESSFA